MKADLLSLNMYNIIFSCHKHSLDNLSRALCKPHTQHQHAMPYEQFIRVAKFSTWYSQWAGLAQTLAVTSPNGKHGHYPADPSAHPSVDTVCS
jgi:hypothetical protein